MFKLIIVCLQMATCAKPANPAEILSTLIVGKTKVLSPNQILSTLIVGKTKVSGDLANATL